MAAGTSTAERTSGGVAPPRRELRLALAMRGGVSLAVWIGGACAELEALRRSADPQDGGGVGMYARLLDAAGYDGVAIDVLAGASAGGLNGALLTTSLLYGVDFDGFRDIWLEVGGLRTLLGSRRERELPPVSLLRGGYFHDALRKRLAAQLDTRDRDRPPAPYVDLHLAITGADPRAVAVTDDWTGWYAEESYRAGFRFRHNRHTSDFAEDPAAPATDDVARAVADKLALAARASASFPGAFAPVAVQVSRPPQLGRRADPADPDDLFGLFSDATRPTSWVVDGGVLDNIPVERALDSIAAAPAASATERWLLYLCPSPEEVLPEAEPSWAGLVPPHLVWTLKAVARASGSRESILEDLAALRAHNDRAGRYRAARDLLASGLGADTDATTAAALLATAGAPATVAAYESDTADLAAARARALLEDPTTALGEDPFVTPLAWPLAEAGGWTRPARDQLEACLRTAHAAALAGAAGSDTAAAAAALGSAPIARLAAFLIGQIRTLEATGGAASALLGPRKEQLYGLLDAARLLTHLGDLFWPLHVTADPPDPDGETTGLQTWATGAVTARQAFLTAAHATGEGSDERFSWLAAELRRRLDVAAGPPPDAENLVAWLWSRLAAEVTAVAGVLPGDGLLTGETDVEVTVRILRAIAAGDADALRCLVALEVVSAPLARLSPTAPQAVRFARLAGTNPTPLPIPSVVTGGRVDVQAKLAGNALANFAAFYRRSWRANDWMWGRLDAVGTILAVLLRPEELGGRLRAAGDGGAAFVEAVRACVTAPFPVPGDGAPTTAAAWDTRMAELWDARSDAVAAEVAALAGGEGGSLATITEVLTARRHWEIVVAELPVVLGATTDDADERWGSAILLRRLLRRLRGGRPPAGDAAPPRTPAEVDAALAVYAVGREAITDDLGSDHLVRLLGDGALAAWSALRHALGGGPAVLRPVGPALRALRAGLLAVPPLRRVLGLAPPSPDEGPGNT